MIKQDGLERRNFRESSYLDAVLDVVKTGKLSPNSLRNYIMLVELY